MTVGAFNGPTPVPYTFTGGLLHLTSQALLIGSTGLLGSNVSTSPTKSIIVDGATTLNPLSLLSINGGTFSTGAFLNSGGSVSLNSGTLGLTNSPLTIGTNQPLGATVKLEFGANIAIAGANNLTVDPLAELQLDGGAVYAGGVTNNGNIVLSAPTSLISGGTLTNNGLISGTGRVASVLSSSSTGEVRVDPNDSIQFQLAGNGSNGKFTLNGGRIEFTHDLTLFSSATVFGRGTLIANGGLANFGTMIFSGAGNSDVFGNVTNINRITVTGGNTTTFWNNVTTSSGEMSVNTNSTAVFVGTLTGQSFITGPGVKDYEGTASGGAIATIVGDTIVESSANVSADLVHEDDVQVYGALQVTPNGSPAHLSQINTLSIPSGKFDLSNNDLITTGTPIASVASDIAGGYNHGDWQGAGLTSSTAAGIAADASNPHKTALGYATASSLGISTFDGQPSQRLNGSRPLHLRRRCQPRWQSECAGLQCAGHQLRPERRQRCLDARRFQLRRRRQHSGLHRAGEQLQSGASIAITGNARAGARIARLGCGDLGDRTSAPGRHIIENLPAVFIYLL